MANGKYYPPRKFMPGAPLPSLTTKAVDARAFQLARGQEYTNYLHFYASDTPNVAGERGYHLDRIQSGDTDPWAFVLDNQGATFGALEADGVHLSLVVTDANQNPYRAIQVSQSGGAAFTLINGSVSCPGAGTTSEHFGASSASIGSRSVAIGNSASAAAVGDVCIGYGAATGASSLGSSVAIGGNASASPNANNQQATAIGYGATASATNATAIGCAATASVSQGIAIGASVTCAAAASLAIGGSISSLGSTNAVAVGISASVGGTQAVALGTSSQANHQGDTALGYNAICDTTIGVTGRIALGAKSVATKTGDFVCGSTSYPISNIFFGNGRSNASPAAATINGTGGSGSNIAGGAIRLAGGEGTGSGAGGSLMLSTAPHGSAGSLANAFVDYFTLDATGLITLCQVDSVQAQAVATIFPTYAVNTDASRQGRLVLSAVDYAGTREGMRIEANGTAPAIGFLGASAVAQQANSVDLGAVLSNFGLRASGGNPPLNLGTGALAAGASSFSSTVTVTAPSAGRCLTLNGSSAPVIFVQPPVGTNTAIFKVNNTFQWGGDFTGTGDTGWHLQNLQTGNVCIDVSGNDLITLGSTNATGGVCVGQSGGKATFYGGTPVTKPTISGSQNGNPALNSLCAALATLNLVTNNTESTDPTAVAFSWVNQGGASVTNANNTSFLSAPANSGDSLRGRVIAVPANPYTLTISFLPQLHSSNFRFCGILLQDSVGGGLVTANVGYVSTTTSSGLYIGAAKWTNTGTIAAPYTTSPALILAEAWQAGACMWLRLKDDGTNRTFWLSNDGQNWLQFLSTTRTDFITPDHIGWFVDVNDSTAGAGMTLLSWQVTQP